MTQFERIGRFEVLDRIGGDAFSLLYSAHDPFEDRPVEIRVCVASDGEFRWRFLEAAEDWLFLRHRNIARVLEFGSGEPQPYLVQEVFPGFSLKERIHSEGPIDEGVKLLYVLQLAQGLQYAHGQGVFHRQISPEVARVGEGERIKLGEFGLAHLASTWIQLQVGGDAYPASGYVLPEVLAGTAPNQRSEVFGFGATAYEILTARPPFSAESLPALVHKILNEDPAPISSLWPDCPEELENSIHKCLCRDPSLRYAGLDEVLEDLSAVLPVPEEPAEQPSPEREVAEEDAQTVHIVDPDSSSGSAPEPESELTSRGPDTGSVTPRPRTDMWRALRESVGRSRAALPTLDEVKGRMQAASWRWLPGLAALLLVVAVAGWALTLRGRVEPSDEVAGPAVTPSMPAESRDTGLLALDALPWAEVTRILDESGEEVPLASPALTPMTLQLPVGHYRVVLTHPTEGEAQECRVQVSSFGRADCRVEFASIEAEDYFRLAGWWQ